MAKPITLIGGCNPADSQMETANELFWNGIFSFTNSLYVIQLMYVDVYPCLHVVISNLEYNVLSVMQIDPSSVIL